MKDIWLKTGCFLTGYKYSIVRNSSEATARTVTKYASAMIIMTILWGFIGYSFAQRYLQTGTLISVLIALVMIVIVIQIERQIILSNGRNLLIPIFRFLIGLVMALIGSIIIDQIIFKEDVEKTKISNVQIEVNDLLPKKTKELDLQIMQIDSAISFKEAERAAIIDEIGWKPFIKATTAEIRHFPVKYNGVNGEVVDTLVRRTDLTLTEVQNPKAALLPNISEQISLLRQQKAEKESNKINIRAELEKSLESKTGFLDEMKVLVSILMSSDIALFVWLVFFFFFMSLEILVLVNRYGEKENDYEKVINHQLKIRSEMIDKLSRQEVA